MTGIPIVVTTEATDRRFKDLVQLAVTAYHSPADSTHNEAFRRELMYLLADPAEAAEVLVYAAHQASAEVHNRGQTWMARAPQFTGLSRLPAPDRTRIMAVLNLLDERQDHVAHDMIRQLCHEPESFGATGGLFSLFCGTYGSAVGTLAAPPAGSARLWAPNPKALPDWRRRILAHTVNELGVLGLTAALSEGLFTLCPDPRPHTDTDDEAGLMDMTDAALFLAQQEAAALARARLYFVDQDLFQVAHRKALRPKKAPVSEERMLPGAGFVVFPEPVAMGGQEARPIVAVSWNTWDPTRWPGGRWIVTRNDHLPEQADIPEFGSYPAEAFREEGRTAWWFTLYTPSTVPGTPLRWETEMIVTDGATFGAEPVPGTNEVPVRIVIALHELITQTELLGKTITRTTEHVRKPTKVRSDRRAGVADDGRVRVITVGGTGTGSVPRPRAGGYKRGPMQHRTWVREHDRQQCPNPHRHAELGDACVHHEITILEHVRGPDGAPFKLPDTVHHLKGAE